MSVSMLSVAIESNMISLGSLSIIDSPFELILKLVWRNEVGNSISSLGSIVSSISISYPSVRNGIQLRSDELLE